MLAFLGILLAQGGFSLLAFAVRQGWEDIGPETLAVGISLAVSVLVISVALSLAGLVCRGRYGWLRLSLWLMAALVVVWLLVLGPFFIFAMIASGGNVPLTVLVAVDRGGSDRDHVWCAAAVSGAVLCQRVLPGAAEGFVAPGRRGAAAGDHPADAGLAAAAAEPEAERNAKQMREERGW